MKRKKILKYLLRTLLVIVLIILMLPALLYIPGVQRYARDKVVDYVESTLGMKAGIGKLSLKFPLNLTLENVYAVKSDTDTLVRLGRLHLDVGLKRIFRKELAVRDLELNRVLFRLHNDTTGMQLQVNLENLQLRAAPVYMNETRAPATAPKTAGRHRLSARRQSMEESDTTTGQPFDWLFQIRRLNLERIVYRMSTVSLPELSARIAVGEIVDGNVNIGERQIEVARLGISGGNCLLRLGESADDSPQPESQPDTSSFWTIKAGQLSLENYAFEMKTPGQQGFQLTLTDIGFRIDSVYNRGPEVRASLDRLQLIRQEGGRIEEMHARIDLEEQKTEAGQVYIRTSDSEIRLNALARASVSRLMRQVPLQVTLEGSVGMKDVALFVPELPLSLLQKRMQLKTDFSLSDDRLVLRQFSAAMRGNFHLSGQGELSSWKDMRNVSGQVKLDGNLTDLSFLDDYLGSSLRLPEGLQLALHLEAREGHLYPRLSICREGGCLTAAGSYAMDSQAYQVELKTDRFELGAFFPSDSLGILTADVQVNGRGYDFGRAQARLQAGVEQLVYRRHAYEGIRLEADVKGMQLAGKISSADTSLLLNVSFQADSIGKRYVAELEGEVKKADLKALQLSSADLSVALGIEVKLSMENKDEFLLNGNLENVRLDDGRGNTDLGGLALRVNSEREKTDIDLISGDFRLMFRGDTSVLQLPPAFAAVADEFRNQIQHREINMEPVSRLLPGFSLSVEGSRNNVMGRYLRMKGVSFRQLRVHAGTLPGYELYLDADIDRPVYGKLEFDSIKLDIRQQARELTYDLRVMNPIGIVKDLYDVRLQGSLLQNRFRTSMLQKNKEGKTGIRIGAELTLLDSAFSVSLFPSDPILGYDPWSVNPGNYFTFYKDRRIAADLKLAYGEKLFSIRSLEDQTDRNDRLQVKIDGIDLEAVSRVTPFIPDISGLLNTDLMFYRQDNHAIVDGKIAVDSFYYQNQRIGDLALDVNYDAANRFTTHAVNFVLHLDEIQRAVAEGVFSTSPKNRQVAIDMSIPSFPLYVINAFLPAHIVKLTGELQGEVKMRGTLDLPQLDGGLAFRDGRADVVMLGTTFGIDSTRLPVREGKIIFDRFQIRAPNKKYLDIEGSIALTPFSDMRADLTLMATNFQVVNVKENPVSLVYGKAYIDLNMALKGPFNGLNINGSVNLLNNTVLDYVLRNSDPQLKDRTQDLVRFVSFGDTTLMEKDDLTNRITTGNFSMRLFVEIGNNVNMNINLSEDGNNRVAIQGGGNLIYSMNPESGNNLVGKYTLTNGSVRYNVPVVGEKNFAIQNGSYVEWTGDLANPLLHITASESVRVSVTEDNQSSRIVTFNAIIRIQNNLRQPEITFDLSAPNDQAIQTQLAAFSAEERTKQAMNLLIYGTYSGPGTVNTGNNANNALNSFVEKELNQWTRKYLKNSGLTFGIDSYNQIGSDGQEVKRTDFSYQFSKQLFNDKVNVKIGGRLTSDNDPGSSMEDNLVDDIAIEYIISKKRDLLLKVFRHTNYESVLEGEVTQTGIGVVWRKSFRKIRDLFIRKKKRMEKAQEKLNRQNESQSKANEHDTK